MNGAPGVPQPLKPPSKQSICGIRSATLRTGFEAVPLSKTYFFSTPSEALGYLDAIRPKAVQPWGTWMQWRGWPSTRFEAVPLSKADRAVRDGPTHAMRLHEWGTRHGVPETICDRNRSHILPFAVHLAPFNEFLSA